MKKILEIFAEPISHGGQESFVMNVLRAMDKTDLKIDLFTPYYCDNEDYKEEIAAINGQIFCCDHKFEPGKSRLFYIGMLKKFFRDHHYDVIHIHSGSITALGYMAFAAKMAGIPKIIVHSHATGFKKNLKYRLIKTYARPFMAIATDYFACSEDAGRWKFSDRICTNKLKIIKNGIKLDRFEYNEDIRQRFRSSLSIGGSDILLGNVGRLTHPKNQLFLIEILNRIKNKNFKLLLIGSGEDEDKIKNKISIYGLEDRVIFTGNVNNVNDYMQAMDIFMFPSIFEGLGIVAIEAQAAGLPVISSTEVPRDIHVTDNVTFLDLEDIDAWVDAVINYQPKERKSQSEELKKAGYDVADTANQIRSEYLCDII